MATIMAQVDTMLNAADLFGAGSAEVIEERRILEDMVYDLECSYKEDPK